jgi:arsenate reductase (thioredoxin)
MAEGWARKLAPALATDLVTGIQSAGLEAHGLNPHAVAVMARQGVDISAQTSDVLTAQMLEQADLLITVCGHADEHCPLLPPGTQKIHLPFPDPARFPGTSKEVDAHFDAVCVQIREGVEALLRSLQEQV